MKLEDLKESLEFYRKKYNLINDKNSIMGVHYSNKIANIKRQIEKLED